MLEQIDKILDIISLSDINSKPNISEYVKKLLDVMIVDVPYTTVALMEKLGLKSRETFRKNYLNPAMDLDLIHMTIPDKPNSRNQRYIRNRNSR